MKSASTLYRFCFSGAVALAMFCDTSWAASGCRIDYVIQNQWPGGFTASVTVTNQGDAANGWNVVWNMPANQEVYDLWNGRYRQTGSTVQVRNSFWNAAIPTGGQVQFGFNATKNSSNPVPAGATLNGVACSINGNGPTATPKPPATPAPSPKPTATPTPKPTSAPIPVPDTSACTASYQIVSQWNDGFTAAVTLRNKGPAMQGWRAVWAMPDGQQITQSWNGNYAQTGNQATVTNAPWNGELASGGSVQFGFNGRHSGSNRIPTALSVNGFACSGLAGRNTPPPTPRPTANPTPQPTATPPPTPPATPTPKPPT
ncbi:MAG: hypothetical protein FIA97_01560, partial [Methylococcaceae bacterium]|nr:hypothetical protein [Methylococcaceae bacterium]